LLTDGEGVGEAVVLAEGLGVGEPVGIGVAELEGLGEGVGLADPLGVGVGEPVGIGVAELEGLGEGVGVEEADKEGLGVGEPEIVGVGVGAGFKVKLKYLLAVAPLVSVTCIKKLNVNGTVKEFVGVPEYKPVELKVKPAGPVPNCCQFV
jgi:hypothetical protein